MSRESTDNETMNEAVTAGEHAELAGGRKNKLRAVWIAFASRIIAQVLGAVATIVLGLLVLHKYQGNNQSPQTSSQAPTRVIRSSAGGPSSKASIAVLPVANFSAGSGDQYIADGMTEAIIARLTQTDALRVISRTSSMRYKLEAKSIPEIGQELDVDLIVESSIVKVGDRVHVTAQLIDAVTDEHIWARSYDRTTSDLLGMQAQLAAEIARDIRVSIGGQDAVSTAGRK